MKGHIQDAVNIVGWALDKVIKECLGDPLSPRLITQTLENNVWNSTLKLSAALNSTPVQVIFDDRAHRVLPMALGNLINGTWKVAGVYNAATKHFVERTEVITWPRTGSLAPRGWIHCAAGQKITPVPGLLSQCQDCPAGTSSFGGQATTCIACAPGYFMAKSGGIECSSCDNLGDFFQELSGQTRCTACPANTRRYSGLLSGANRSACQCMKGSFHDDGVASEGCIVCVAGLTCEGRLEPPTPSAGFVVSSSTNQHGSPSVAVSTCVQCRNRQACAGGAGSPCAQGYTGRRCGICDDGFYVWGGFCMSCGHDATVYFLAVLLIVLVFVLTSFFIWQTLLDPRVGSPIVFILRLLETLGLMSSMVIDWPGVVLNFLSTVNLVNFNTEMFRTECLFGHPHPISKAVTSAFLPVVLFAAGLILFPVLRFWSRRAAVRLHAPEVSESTPCC